MYCSDMTGDAKCIIVAINAWFLAFGNAAPSLGAALSTISLRFSVAPLRRAGRLLRLFLRRVCGQA